MTVSQPPAITGHSGEEISHQHGPASAVHAPWQMLEVIATCSKVDGPRAATAESAQEEAESTLESQRNRTRRKRVPIPVQGLL